jgi:hypothetical protein
MVGYNINQAPGSTVVNTWIPTGSGILVNIGNPGNSPLRVQIQGPNGATDANDRWCTNISTFNQDVMLEWGFFSTQCWSGATAPVYYNGTSPLTAVIVLVPGTNTTSVPFNFCVNKIALPGGGGGSGSGTGGSSACGNGNLQGSGTLTGQYDWQIGSRDGKQYVVQNNVWGTSASQTVTWRGNTFQVTAQSGIGDTSGAPASYPSAFIGSNYQRTTQGSGLPKQVSSLASVQSSVTWASNGASGTYNAAYDIWFSTASAGDTSAPSGGYVMVWLYKPSGAQPIGSPVGNFSFSGTAYQVWYGTNSGRPCVSFVANGTQNTFTGDLNLFIKEATRLSYIPASWYLTNVLFGFEIWSGGVGLAVTDFYVNVT